MTVRTYQHPKAIGNARQTARGSMHVILRDVVGQDVVGGTDTPYGPERVAAVATITCNPATGEGILASGHLERYEADAMEGELRVSHKEAYTLYWLPWGWDDYQGNPQAVGTDINPDEPQQVDYITAGTRLWIVLDTSDLQDIHGTEAHEFIVSESRRQGPGDVVAFEAVVIRSEGTPPRQVVVA